MFENPLNGAVYNIDVDFRIEMYLKCFIYKKIESKKNILKLINFKLGRNNKSRTINKINIFSI